jgi:FkbM family methyltransferase
MSQSRPESILKRPRSLPRRVYRLVNKPYYWYRPAQLMTRVRAQGTANGEVHLVRTAWGSHLYCWPDPLGRAVARTGVYDLAVTETLARLADPGDTAIDAGANVGLMSSLLAYAVGARGQVLAFEPHPVILDTLNRNASRWREHEAIANVQVRAAAVSSISGTLTLAVDPATFARNKGTASLDWFEPSAAAGVEVQALRLDDELSAPVGVLKLDLEGHELAALQGASELLREGLVRDIVFEEHLPPPTPVTRLLESHGYTVLGVSQGVTGPIAGTAQDAHERRLWDPPALLATREPQRARERLRAGGWVCLRAGLRKRAAT